MRVDAMLGREESQNRYKNKTYVNYPAEYSCSNIVLRRIDKIKRGGEAVKMRRGQGWSRHTRIRG